MLYFMFILIALLSTQAWAQTAPGVGAVQWHAHVPNSVSWKLLCALIVSAGALVAYGVHSFGASWEAKGALTPRTRMITELTSKLLVAPALGAYCGWLVWDPHLGGLSGFVGGWAAPRVMRWLNQLATKVIDKVGWPFGRKP